MTPTEKEELYAEKAKEIGAVIVDESNLVARMATVSNILHHAFDQFYWTGFYIVDRERPDELVVGPYQGTLGCLRVPFGKGVCGMAAQTGEIQIVDDVHSFPGHIACDASSQSEIVVPVRDQNQELVAVFDVDSITKSSFDEIDAGWLNTIMEISFGSTKI